MDLATGRVIRWPKVTLCSMIQMVIERVELLASLQGLKSLKFLDRKNQEMGVGGRNFSSIVEEVDERSEEP